LAESASAVMTLSSARNRPFVPRLISLAWPLSMPTIRWWCYTSIRKWWLHRLSSWRRRGQHGTRKDERPHAGRTNSNDSASRSSQC